MLAEELVSQLPQGTISEISLVPSSGGVFEVSVNDRLIFSKKQLGRHAEPGEIKAKIEAIA